MARLAAVIGEVFCVGGGMLWWRGVPKLTRKWDIRAIKFPS